MSMCCVEACESPAAKSRMCSAHYQRWWKYGDPRFVVRCSNGGRCSVIGCSKAPRSPTSPHCEMHYGRLRRGGTLEKVRQAKRVSHTHGYVLVPAPGHRLTTSGQSHVYEHRKVFYAAHGEGPFSCHVCGVAVTWADMHVDHLNDIKDDNRLENLAPACERCNPWRGKDRSASARRSKSIRWLELNGERLPMSAWAKRLGIRSWALQQRLERWPLERALTEPCARRTGPRPSITS